MRSKQEGNNLEEKDKKNLDEQTLIILKDTEIAKLNLKRDEIKEKIKQYQEDTGKHAVWLDRITGGFKNWLKGEKIYDRAKERISFYLSEERREKWQDFVDTHPDYNISKLIREGVDFFIKNYSKLIDRDNQKSNNISHSLKESLTTIKGFSQLLLDSYQGELSEEVILTIRSILNQSMHLERKILTLLDDVNKEPEEFDILLIEDDLPTIRLIKTYFEKKGYTCKGIENGKMALEELEIIKPKLILLDIILPDISGYEICKILKDNEKFKQIPTIYLTAVPGNEVKEKLAETGADGYLLKPFNISDLETLFKYL